MSHLAHALQCFEPIHFWQPDVEEHQVHLLVGQVLQALLSGANRVDQVPLFTQDRGEGVAYSRFVVDD